MSPNSKKFLIRKVSRERIVTRKEQVRVRLKVCPLCPSESEMLALDSAVSVSGISALRILELSNSGEVHVIESQSGHLWVCRRTLEGFAGKDEPTR